MCCIKMRKQVGLEEESPSRREKSHFSSVGYSIGLSPLLKEKYVYNTKSHHL